MSFKALVFSFVYLLTPFVFSQDEVDIPPPPMPDYMKAEQGEMVDKKPMASSKLQAEPVESPQAKKNGKFLNNETGDTPTIYRKGASIEDEEMASMEEDDTEINAEDPQGIREQFLKAGQSDEAIADAQDEEDTHEEELPLDQLEGTDTADEGSEEAPEEVATKEATPLPNQEEKKIATLESPKESSVVQSDQEQELSGLEEKSVTNEKPFKGGLHRFLTACDMHEAPDVTSQKVGKVKKDKKLWIDPHNSQWRKAYKKSGTVYVSAECVAN